MVIPISTDIKNFFLVYLKVLDPIAKLKKREREVLAVLLLVYYTNRSKGQEELSKLLFSKETRKYLRDHINMSEASYNNHIKQLRDKKMLIGDEISPFLLKNLPKGNDLEIAYHIKIYG